MGVHQTRRAASMNRSAPDAACTVAAGAVDAARAHHPGNSSAAASALLDSCRAAGYQLTSALATSYFAEHWWPVDSACRDHGAYKQRFGPTGEGGKVLCSPKEIRSLGSPRCLAVSVGLNGDTRAEQDIHRTFPHCAIHGYDGTLNAAKRAKLPDNATLQYFPLNFGPTTYQRYEGRSISLLKIDCEGCELHLLAPWLDRVCTEQVAVEVHGCSRMRYAVGKAHTRLSLVHALFVRLDREFELFHREGNPRFPDGCLEVSWRRRRPCEVTKTDQPSLP